MEKLLFSLVSGILAGDKAISIYILLTVIAGLIWLFIVYFKKNEKHEDKVERLINQYSEDSSKIEKAINNVDESLKELNRKL